MDLHDVAMVKLTKNIDMAFYRQTLRHADAARVALWHRLYGKLKGVPEEGQTQVPQTVVNQHFMQTIINLGKEFNEIYDKKLREHIKSTE